MSRCVRPSEAEIEDCGMRKRALPLAQIPQHEKKTSGHFSIIYILLLINNGRACVAT